MCDKEMLWKNSGRNNVPHFSVETSVSRNQAKQHQANYVGSNYVGYSLWKNKCEMSVKIGRLC